jgi:hypothetical protein
VQPVRMGWTEHGSQEQKIKRTIRANHRSEEMVHLMKEKLDGVHVMLETGFTEEDLKNMGFSGWISLSCEQRRIIRLRAIQDPRAMKFTIGALIVCGVLPYLVTAFLSLPGFIEIPVCGLIFGLVSLPLVTVYFIGVKQIKDRKYKRGAIMVLVGYSVWALFLPLTSMPFLIAHDYWRLEKLLDEQKVRREELEAQKRYREEKLSDGRDKVESAFKSTGTVDKQRMEEKTSCVDCPHTFNPDDPYCMFCGRP